MVDFKPIKWDLEYSYSVKIESRSDNLTKELPAISNQKVIRLDIVPVSNPKYADYISAGRLSVSVKIGTTQATVHEHKVYYGKNIIVLPNYIDNIANFYLNFNRVYIGAINIKLYSPTVTIDINPKLNQESLDAIFSQDKQQNIEILKEIEKIIKTNIKLTISDAITNNESIKQIKGDIIDISAYLTSL